MDPLPAGAIHAHFATLPDPRVDRAKRHDLLAIVTIALCAVIGGADSWVEVERFGRAKRSWFEARLPLPHGIPSHDTFGRVFAALDPVAFERCLLGWVQALVGATTGEVVVIDGKTLRRSHDRSHGQAPSIWSVPGQPPTASSLARWPRMTIPTRSPPCRPCLTCWPSTT